MTEANRQELRRQAAERARDQCEYCRSLERYATHPFSLEHVMPRSRGGLTHIDNLAIACQGCNNHKYHRTEGVDPLTRRVAPLFNPRRDAWNEHFRWDESFEQVLGITASGRATVELLHLNRACVVRLRRLLYLAGEHPASRDVIA